MKNLKFLFLFCLTLAFITSCGKEEDPKDEETKLDVPTLISPVNNATVLITPSSNSTFDWSDVLNATEYQFEISNVASFASVIESEAVTISEIDPSGANLIHDSVYFWRVRALAPGFENSDYSAVYSFTFSDGGGSQPVAFNLVSPANNTTNIPLTQTFVCDEVPNASIYNFYIGPQSTGSTWYTSPVNVLTVSLSPDEVYTWSVEAEDVNGDIFYSPSWSFSTVACEVCGFYQGSSNGNLAVSAINLDTTFNNISTTLDVTSLGGNNYNLTLDITTLLNLPGIPVEPDFDGTLTGNTITVTNQTYNFPGISAMTINGSVNFTSPNLADGSFTFSGGAIGTVSFSGAK